MALAYLFDPNIQFQYLNGVNNVAGFLRVYYEGTDNRATTYKNFIGTLNPADIPIDNNGRAVVIVEAEKTYRLEVYGKYGNLMWTQRPLCALVGGGGSFEQVQSNWDEDDPTSAAFIKNKPDVRKNKVHRYSFGSGTIDGETPVYGSWLIDIDKPDPNGPEGYSRVTPAEYWEAIAINGEVPVYLQDKDANNILTYAYLSRAEVTKSGDTVTNVFLFFVRCGYGNVLSDSNGFKFTKLAGSDYLQKAAADSSFTSLSKTGDSGDTKPTFSVATAVSNISSGEKLSVMLGKIAKWFSSGFPMNNYGTKTIVTMNVNVDNNGYTKLVNPNGVDYVNVLINPATDGELPNVEIDIDNTESTVSTSVTVKIYSGGSYTILHKTTDTTPSVSYGKIMHISAHGMGWRGTTLGEGANIGDVVPPGTSVENQLVNMQLLYKELHRVPNGGTLLAGAKVGDILWVDPNNGDKYFFDKAFYPVSQAVADGLESVGVVADVDGRKLLILHKDESTNLQFSSCWLFKVTGIHLDGTTNTLNMQQHASNDSAVPAGTFTDSTSTTLADFCTALDTWLREHQTIPGAMVTNWHCELMPDKDGVDSCFIVIDSTDYQNRQSPIAGGSTATATFYMWQFAGQNTDRYSLLRNNGSNVYYAGWNKERLIEYFSDPTHPSVSPTDNPNGTGILNKADFEGASYPNVKAAYNNDYATYIEAMMMKWPSETGSQAAIAGTGPSIGVALGTHTHKNLAGETVHTFPASRYSYTRATTGMKKSDNLGDGAWHLPDVIEAFKVFSKMAIDGTDAINDSLSAIGASAQSLSVIRWTSSRYYGDGGWFTANNGFYNGFFFSGLYKAPSVAVLEY